MKEFLIQKRWLAGCAAFLSIFSYLFIHITYLLRPISADRKIISGYYSEPDYSLDMLYIGGSACFMYWAPIEAYKQYGITSYSLGFGSMDPKVLKTALKEALRTQSPSLIVIDARPFQYGGAEAISELSMRNYADSVQYSWDRMRIVNQLVPSKLILADSADKASFLLDIIKYHTRWTELDHMSWNLIDNKNKNKNMGFSIVEKFGYLKEIGCSQITEEAQLTDALNEIFIDLLEYCSSLDAQVLFVTNSYLEQPEDRMKYNYIKRIISGYGNISYINTNDYNQHMGLDYSKDFIDINHVSIFGAEKFTGFLAGYIQQQYRLPDHRGTEEVSFYWDAMIPEWEQTVLHAKKTIMEQIDSQGTGQPQQ